MLAAAIAIVEKSKLDQTQKIVQNSCLQFRRYLFVKISRTSFLFFIIPRTRFLLNRRPITYSLFGDCIICGERQV